MIRPDKENGSRQGETTVMDMGELIESYVSGADTIKNVMRGIPAEAYDFMPAVADDWTIRQHIVHLVDSEVNNFIRIKSCIAQPASDVYVINELDWVKNLGIRNDSVDDYLALFSLIRKIIGGFLATVDEKDFSTKYFVRAYNGETRKITMKDAVEMYRNHVTFHVDFIDRIYAEYSGAK